MSNKPALEVKFMYPSKKEGGKDFSQKVGSLWPTKDGKGFSGELMILGQYVRVMVYPPFDDKKEVQITDNRPNAFALDDDMPF